MVMTIQTNVTVERMIVEQMIVARITMIVARITMIVARITMIVARITMIGE